MLKSRKHINIPVFIPHLGCPNDCVFCNQRSISGKIKFDPDSVIDDIEQVLSTVKDNDLVEIAFFGGSFTGIDRSLMTYLLDIAQGFVNEGKVSSIRLSTRPDYITDEILTVLGRYSVKTIELGIQSMDDSVLLASRRGHIAEQTKTACRLIKNAGFDLIGQMMIGLPQANIESEKNTAREICLMGADGARIYPTVVFYETELCKMAQNGDYVPLDIESAVFRTKEVLKIFNEYNVPCIRVGLCASENLSSDTAVYGGANHSAIGELAISEIFYEKIDEAFAMLKQQGKLSDRPTVFVPIGCMSKAIGQKRKNIIKICEKYSISNVKVVEKNSIIGYNILLNEFIKA